MTIEGKADVLAKDLTTEEWLNFLRAQKAKIMEQITLLEFELQLEKRNIAASVVAEVNAVAEIVLLPEEFVKDKAGPPAEELKES